MILQFWVSDIFYFQVNNPIKLLNLLNPFWGHRLVELIQLLLGEDGVHPEQVTSRLQGHTLTPRDNLDSPNHIQSMFWTAGGNQTAWRKPTHAREEVHTEKTQPGFKIRTFLP